MSNDEIKLETYFAHEIHDTWAKKGYLFSNGLFVTTFMFFNKPAYTAKIFSENDIEQIQNGELKIQWGKGFLKAFTDYQTFQLAGESDSLSKEDFQSFVKRIVGKRKLIKAGTSGMLKGATSIDELLMVIINDKK